MNRYRSGRNSTPAAQTALFHPVAGRDDVAPVHQLVPEGQPTLTLKQVARLMLGRQFHVEDVVQVAGKGIAKVTDEPEVRVPAANASAVISL